MASPHVAAAAALVMANSASRPDRTTMRELLMGSADRTPEMNGHRWTSDVGAGRLNLERLMLAVTRL